MDTTISKSKVTIPFGLPYVFTRPISDLRNMSESSAHISTTVPLSETYMTTPQTIYGATIERHISAVDSCKTHSNRWKPSSRRDNVSIWLHGIRQTYRDGRNFFVTRL